MANRPHPKKARTDASSPQAWATCDRCNCVVNLVDLRVQVDWRGLSLQSLFIRVCDTCYDAPQRQLGTIILPPDPVSVINARPEAYPSDESWPRLLQNGAPRYLQTQGGTEQAFARQLQYSKYFS